MRKFICSLALMLCLTTIVTPLSASVPKRQLITSVNTTRFFSRLKLQKPAQVEADGFGLRYRLPKRAKGITENLSVGVFSSAQEAQKRFSDSTMHVHGGLELSKQRPTLRTTGAGDQVFCLGAVNGHPGLWSGSIMLRRSNVIFTASWRGNSKSALAYAKKVDQIILRDNLAFPRGMRVLLPDISLSKAPTTLPLKKQFYVKYKVGRPGVRVRSREEEQVWTKREWTTHGGFTIGGYRRMGKRRDEYAFVTTDGVIQSKIIDYQMVTLEPNEKFS